MATPLDEDNVDLVGNFIDSDAIRTCPGTGHAKLKEESEIIDHSQFMEQTHQPLLGYHLKDVTANCWDNQALGTGTVDFEMAKKYFRQEHVLGIDLNPSLASEEVIHSRDYLSKLIGES